jgi:Cu(I)/Ag(I) efflux system membrane protein CusA/SilA
MPPLDEGDLMYMPTTLPGISIAEARALLQRTDRLIASMPEVDRVFGKVGRAETATDPAPLTMIETFITLKPRAQWREGMTTEKIKQELNVLVDLPGVSNAWVMPIKARIDMLSTGVKTPIGIKVSGPDLDTLQELAVGIEQALKNHPGTSSIYAERSSGGRYVVIDVKREAAARYGLNIDDVHAQIRHAIGGIKVY